MTHQILDLSEERAERLWSFVRGDTPGPEFENWLYAWDEAEKVLGSDVYEAAYDTNFARAHDVAAFKSNLKSRLPVPEGCKCCTIPNRGSVGMGDWAQKVFVGHKMAPGGRPWHRVMSCTACPEEWLIAEDDLIYDHWILERVGGPGLPDTHTYRGLLKAAKASSASVRFSDPENSVMLRAAIEDLAKETPRITLTDLVDLLPISRETTMTLAIKAIESAGVQIDLNT